MKLHWLKKVALGLLLVCTMLVAGVFMILRTETGAGWIIHIAQSSMEGLEINHRAGSIHGGLELQDVSYRTPAYALQVDSLDVAVRADWFPFTLRVEWLQADHLVYAIFASEEEEQTESLPEDLGLPIPVELPRIGLTDIQVLDEQGAEIFAARSLGSAVSVSRNLSVHTLELVIDEGTVNLEGMVALQNPFPMELALQGELELPIEEEPESLVLDLEIKAAGSVSGIDLETRGTADPPRFAAHSFAADSHVTLSGMETTRFEISGPDLLARGTGGADWNESWARLEDVAVEISGTELRINADLLTDLESGNLQGKLVWKGLTWPLRADAPDWISPEGDISLSGTIDQWSLAGQLEAQAKGYPAGQMRIEADGDRGGLQASIPEMTILGGNLKGAGSYRWDEAGVFAVEMELQNLSTESIAPEYPAVLSGKVAANGRLDPLRVSLDVSQLSGEALGKPIAAHGRIEVSQEAITATDFNILSGSSRIVLDGFPDEQNGLEFTADITNLGDFLPNSQGVIAASGTLFLRSDWPAIRLAAQGTGIGWQDYQVSSLTINGSNQDPALDDSAFEVSLTEARIGGTTLDEAHLSLVLAADRQAASINATSGTTEIEIGLAGAIERAEGSPGEWSWKGQLESLQAVLGGKDEISLQNPASVNAAAESAHLDGACLVGPRSGTLCLDADWSTTGGTSMNARIEQISLDAFNELMGMDLRLSQLFSGDLQMQLPPGGKPSGSADFHITAGTIAYVDDPEPLLETGQGKLAFTLAHGRLTAGVLDIPITGQGVIDIDYHIPDVTDGLGAQLAGTLLIDLADLDLLSIVLPMADQVSGSLKADLVMSGTLGQPYFSGRFDLRDGLLANRASGLRLEDIELSGNLVGNGETRLTGGFRAAEGVGELQALIDLRNIHEPQFELGVSGEQLMLFDSEDLKIVIDTDFNVALQPGSVTIDGAVHVPSALIAPAVIPEQTVSESTDLVITAGRPTGEVVEEEEAQPLSILGDLKLSLGDDVTLDLTVAELDLSGELDFHWMGEPLPFANGSLGLEGEIVAFGQRLQIAQGDISFPGGPADNPHLNIRAEREIYGNSEVRRAGLLVAGTVRRPVVEPYTDPMTNRDRAQTLLVTGSDFNMERGVGAVDIGTYIAPRIFLSYGVGVFDNSSILSIRYDLGRGWGVKATSGERQTGLDISYTVER